MLRHVTARYVTLREGGKQALALIQIITGSWICRSCAFLQGTVGSVGTIFLSLYNLTRFCQLRKRVVECVDMDTCLLDWHVSGVRRSFIQTALGISQWLSVHGADGEIRDPVLSPERGWQRKHMSWYPQRQMVCTVRCPDGPVINTESPWRCLMLLRCVVLSWQHVSVLGKLKLGPRVVQPTTVVTWHHQTCVVHAFSNKDYTVSETWIYACSLLCVIARPSQQYMNLVCDCIAKQIFQCFG